MTAFFAFPLLIGLCFVPAGVAENYSILRDTEQGRIEGEKEVVDGEEIAIFRGVPFAQAPIRDLRFKVQLRITEFFNTKNIVVESCGIS